LVETKTTLPNGQEIVLKTEEVVSTPAAEVPEEVKGDGKQKGAKNDKSEK